MPRRARLLNALAAICAVLLVAAVLAAFGRTPASGKAVRAAGPVATPSPQTTAAPASTTSAAPTTTVAPTTTTRRTAAPAPTTVATTTAPAPVIDAIHRVPIATASFTFIDPSRPTPPAQGDPGGPTRTLPTVVRYPAVTAGRAFPLIVFAHGYQSSPSVYAALLDSWSGAGYVVAAPSFPRGTAGGPLDEGDLANQPGDLSFVITRVLALAAPGGPLAGLVDASRIGVAGHSDGASTTEGIGYNSCCRDKRVQADIVMEGDEHSYANGAMSVAGAPPLLVIQADHDALNPAGLGLQLFHDARSPKFLLWLVNAQHLEPFTTDLAHLAVVEAVTTSFFDRYLKARADGVAAMQRSTPPGVATLTAG